MIEFNAINEKTDTSTLEMHSVYWDVIVDGKQYVVFQFPDMIHTIGGKWDNNSYYCCPLKSMKCSNCSNSRDKNMCKVKESDNYINLPYCHNFKPKAKTLTAFNGEPCNWNVKTESKNYVKCKYDIDSVQSSYYNIEILRNDEHFYEFDARDLYCGLAKAQLLLSQVNEHPIAFNDRNYQKEIIGRKIFYKGYPAIINRYSQGCIFIDYDKDYVNYFVNGYGVIIDDDVLKDDIFSEHINWFRNKQDSDEWLKQAKGALKQ